MDEKKVYSPDFLIINLKIQQDYNLSDFESMLYSFIAFYLHKENSKFYFTNKQLAKIFKKKSGQTVSNSLSALADKNLITLSYKIEANNRQIRNVELQDPYNKNYMAPIIKIIVNNNRLKNISKDIYHTTSEKVVGSVSENTIKDKLLHNLKNNTVVKEYKTNSLIEYWNALPLVPRHKDASSKVYRRIADMLINIQRGRFFSYRGTPITDDFKKRHSIKLLDPNNGVWCSLSSGEIKEVLLKLSLMFSPLYLPADKSWLKKISLEKLIYNRNANTSWFLAMCYEEPKKIRIQRAAQAEKYPKELESFIQFVSSTTETSRIMVAKCVDEIINFYRKLPASARSRGCDFLAACGTERDFLIHYRDYLLRQSWMSAPSISSIDIKSKVFRAYLRHHWDEQSNGTYNSLDKYL